MKMFVRLFALLLLATSAFAQEAAPKKLRVIAKPVEPFVIEKEGGALTGYSIDLWKQVAQEAKLDFEFQVVKSVPEAIEKLKAGEADVAVGAFSITAEREAILDFSHPFYETGLKILTTQNSDGGLMETLRGVMKKDIFQVIGVVIVALLVNSFFLWFFERRINEDSFPANPIAGMFEAAWWSICTLVTGGCENIAPKGVMGRLTAVIWMLAGVGLVSYVTATFASTMTVNNLTGDIKDLKSLLSLPAGSVGTVGGSAAAKFLAGVMSKNPPNTDYKTVNELGDALARGDKGLKAAVYDEPLLAYYVANHPAAKLALVGDLFEKGSYGFALQKSSPIRKELNRALLKLAEEGAYDSLKEKYFATEAKP